MSLSYLTISGARQMLESKQVSSVELTQHYLDCIKKIDPEVNAYVTVTDELALKQAHESDARRAKGQLKSALDGIPGALKDVICVKGVRATASSKMLENFVPPYSAHVATLLDDSGMILLGKTNLDEFAMGATTEYSAFGVSKNPWDLTKVAGGSSGGSAVAVSADEALFSLGTDTGGSIRLPAAWTGVVGFKPTYGRVSRRGVIAMASSLDQVGVFSRSVTDAAEILSIIAKPDALDSTSVKNAAPDYASALSTDLKGVRIGVVKEFMSDAVDEQIRSVIQTAIERLKSLGAEVKEVSIPLAELALAVYCVIVPAEVSTNLERYDGIRYGFSVMDNTSEQALTDIYSQSRGLGLGAEAKRRSMLGAFVLSVGHIDQYYAKAQAVRALITRRFSEAFLNVDCLVGPVSPTMAFDIGQNANDPLKAWMADLLTVPANIAGLPGMSIPCGMVGGLPVGLQIIANQFREDNIIKVASSFEASTDWHSKHPLEDAKARNLKYRNPKLGKRNV